MCDNPQSAQSDYLYVQGSSDLRKIKTKGEMGGWVHEKGQWVWKKGYGKFIKQNGQYIWVHLGLQQ
jgi:hypothetical protein